jgi:hypothetical protein
MLGFRSSPDLSAAGRIVVYDPDANVARGRSHRSRHARGPGTDHQHIEPLRISHLFSLPFPARTGSGSFDNAAFH